jgi:hypothetical protein
MAQNDHRVVALVLDAQLLSDYLALTHLAKM